MKLTFTCIAMLIAMLILSCNQSDNAKVNDIEIQELNKAEDETALAPIASSNTKADFTDTSTMVLHAGQPALKTDWDKKLIKTANITLELKEYNSFNNIIHNNIKRYGAYIASEQQNETDYKIENITTIKVPVEEFENLMNAIPLEGVKVLEKRISTEDVSGQLVDTKARIEAKKQVRDRYFDLLKQAKNMKEILEVQTEINELQESIEAGSGRVQFLSQQSAYSTINLTYFQVLNATVQPDSSPTFFSKLAGAFSDGASIITGLILLMVTFWPILLAGFAAWFIVKKSYWKRVVKKV